MRAEGFLGRLAARSMAALGVEAEPDRWSLETVLYAALQVHDAPGAMTLGVQDACAPSPRLEQDSLFEALNAAAAHRGYSASGRLICRRRAAEIPCCLPGARDRQVHTADPVAWRQALVRPAARRAAGQRDPR
jgi:hypothetical protein